MLLFTCIASQRSMKDPDGCQQSVMCGSEPNDIILNVMRKIEGTEEKKKANYKISLGSF